MKQTSSMKQQLSINLRYCYSSRTGMWNPSTIMGRMTCALTLAGRKSN